MNGLLSSNLRFCDYKNRAKCKRDDRTSLINFLTHIERRDDILYAPRSGLLYLYRFYGLHLSKSGTGVYERFSV